MADVSDGDTSDDTTEPSSDPNAGEPRGSSSPDPGIGGAIKDFIGGVAKYFAPKSISEASQRESAQEDGATRLDNGSWEAQ